ncbi:hypothetical protein [Novosphingobium decolorationis]|uniref:Uncharacterized protein n=1 Tax=Novosphingobium decolorationis TaxID=2698673 RepID=A0ABX8E3N4_9SPHN|nr:hypothetical protein [Novosphingobium decolorationis]QVM83718.1 hypothetical protein HT578_08410 [Novosphingobium decolorationis]
MPEPEIHEHEADGMPSTIAKADGPGGGLGRRSFLIGLGVGGGSAGLLIAGGSLSAQAPAGADVAADGDAATDGVVTLYVRKQKREGQRMPGRTIAARGSWNDASTRPGKVALGGDDEARDVLVGTAVDAANLQAQLDAKGGKTVVIPPATNIDLGNTLSYAQAGSLNSTWIKGAGARFSSRITFTPSAPQPDMARFGNGRFGQFQTGFSDLQLDGADKVTRSVVFFDKTNFSRFENVWIQGTNGKIGFLGRPGAEGAFFQEVSFRNFTVMPEQEKQKRAGCGVDIDATGNIDFWHSNVEFADVGLRLYGAGSTASLTWIGGRMERISGYCFELEQCQALIQCEAATGALWLGGGVTNSRIALTGANSGFPGASTAIVDNGLANEVTRGLALPQGGGEKAGRVGNPGHVQRGDEWLRVPDINVFPLFEDGAEPWSVQGGALSTSGNPLSFFAREGAQSLVWRDAGRGSALERGFVTSAGTRDYLVVVAASFTLAGNGRFALVLRSDKGQELARQVISGYVEGADKPNKTMMKVVKLGVSDYAGPRLVVRLEALSDTAEVALHCCMVKPSLMRHSAAIAGSTRGGGGGFTGVQSVGLTPRGVPIAPAMPATGAGGMIFRCSLGNGPSPVPSFLGLFGTMRDPQTRAMLALGRDPQAREYTMYVPSIVPDAPAAQLFAGGQSAGRVEVAQRGLYPVYSQAAKVPAHASLQGQLAPGARTVVSASGQGPRQLLSGRIELQATDDVPAGWALELRSRLGNDRQVLFREQSDGKGWSRGQRHTFDLARALEGNCRLLANEEELELVLGGEGGARPVAFEVSASLTLVQYA